MHNRKRFVFYLAASAVFPLQAIAQCEYYEANDNQAYEIGDIRVVEHVEFVYSTYNEPELVASEEGNGNNAVFEAIERAINTVESTIKDNGKGKKYDLFSVRKTSQPFHPTQETGDSVLNHGLYVDNNYASVLFSGDGINSIGWVDFAGNNHPFISQNIGAITYTVWNESKEIIERDIIFQANAWQNWAVLADLTQRGDIPNDCADVLDVQGVMTHMLAQAVGLRPVTPDGDPGTGTEETSTMWDAWADLGLSGRVVLSNVGFPSHHWQTLTPGDAQGLATAAPDKKAAFTEPEEEIIAEYEQVVLYYNFESLAGDSIPDQSGNQLNGTLVGTASQIIGPVGQAIDLSGGQYIDLDGAAIPREKLPTDEFTLAAWMNVSPEMVALEPSLLTAVMPQGITAMEHFFFPAGFVILANADSGTNLADPLVNNPFQPAVVPEGWFHYAVSWDRASGEARLYIGGAVVGVLSLNDARLGNDWSGGAWIGKWVDGAPYRLNGALDEFVLANYAMTAAEIAGLVAGNSP